MNLEGKTTSFEDSFGIKKLMNTGGYVGSTNGGFSLKDDIVVCNELGWMCSKFVMKRSPVTDVCLGLGLYRAALRVSLGSNYMKELEL